MAPPGPQGASPPSSAPASPPDLASLYMKLSQQDRAADMFNRGLSGMQASLAPPGQQSAWLGSTPPMQDAGVQIGNLMKIQQAQVAAQEHAQAAAGAEATYQANFPGSKPGLGTELFNMGKLPDVMANHIASLNPTDAMKTTDAAASAYAAANPSATAQDIAQFKANLLGNAVGNLDPLEKQMRNDALRFQQANPRAPLPPYLSDITQYRAHQDVVANAQKDLTTEKNQFDSTNSKFDSMEQNLAWLKTHSQATINAVKDANWRTEGGVSQLLPTLTGGEDADTLQARALLNTMNSQFMGEAIHGMGRIGFAEASKLGGGLTSLGNRGLSSNRNHH